MEKLVSVGKILNFHGIQGEAKVGYTNTEVMKNLKKVAIDGSTYTVSAVRFHKTFAIIKFKEINSINELMVLKGKSILIDQGNVKKSLEDNQFLVSDLIGLNVFDNKDDLIGIVTKVGTNTGNDILYVKSENPDKGEILIPFVKEIVPIIDIKGKKVVIKPIEGLL